MFEQSYGRFNYYVASDECGRGPLAGPVLACSVGVKDIFLEEYVGKLIELGITDSKKLTEKKILKIIQILEIPKKLPVSFTNKKVIKSKKFEKLDIAVYANSNHYIDKNNILVASLDAMKNSFKAVERKKYINSNVLWLVDGQFTPELTNYSYVRKEAVVKGDSRSILIGLASVVAKYYRDLWMQKLDCEYPGYGLAKHKGYPTAEHRRAIKQLGPSEIHRKTFRGVKS